MTTYRREPPLLARIRALYEDSTVRVREIAELAGVSERTIYKYASAGRWRPRYAWLGGGMAGRFAPLATDDALQSADAKALTPADVAKALGRRRDIVARARAAGPQLASEAQALANQARADWEERRRQSALTALTAALTELARMQAEDRAQPGLRSRRAKQLAARLEDAVFTELEAALKGKG